MSAAGEACRAKARRARRRASDRRPTLAHSSCVTASRRARVSEPAEGKARSARRRASDRRPTLDQSSCSTSTKRARVSEPAEGKARSARLRAGDRRADARPFVMHFGTGRPRVIEIFAVLAFPLLGAAVLALFGHRDRAAADQRRLSVATLVAAAALTVARHRRRTAARRRQAVLRRPVQRVPGRADRVRRLHDVDLLAAVHADRAGARPAHARHGCASITACTSSSISRCCWRCSPTTWASCGSRWRRPRSRPCCSSRCTGRRRASRPRGNTSSCAASASRRRCSARSCSISPRRSCSAPRAARCCGPSSTRQGPARADRAVALVRVPAGRLRDQGRASCRCTTGCPTRTPRARRRCRRCSPGCCSTSRCTRSSAARCWSKARCTRRSRRS